MNDELKAVLTGENYVVRQTGPVVFPLNPNVKHVFACSELPKDVDTPVGFLYTPEENEVTKTKPGQRNTAVFVFASMQCNMAPETWQEDVRTFNLERCDPPLPDAEVEAIIVCIDKNYTGIHG